MEKRIKYSVSNYFTTLFVFAFIQGCQPKEEKSNPPKPNIVYIMADDLGYGDLSSYGQQKFETPNIDRLAKEGMLFTQHYSGTTVCAPSRSSLMTGLHTGHTPIRGNRGINGGQYPLPPDVITIPKILKKAGYVTGVFGKWGLGYPGSAGDPLNQGFDEFFGYNSQTISHNYYARELSDNDKVIELKENSGTEHGVYTPNLIQERTLDFIDRHRDTTFFLYVPSIIPHAELFAPEEYMEMFVKRTSPEPPHAYESKFAPETPYEGIDDPEHPRYKVGGYGSQPYPRATFAAMVKLLDYQVGEILDKLDALGLADNTLVIFTSDNGPHVEGGADPDFFNSNGPFQGYKRDLHEGGIRIPMLARWPGRIASESRTDHVSAFWDVLPTLCEVVGMESPEGIDGISYLPSLLGEAQQEHEYLYWEFHEQQGKQAVRKGDWKAIRLDMFGDTPKLFLFDLSEDLGEAKNLASEHPEVLEELIQIMDTARMEDPEWPFLNHKKLN
ncbi:arylsulfatase [Algoriphagus sp. AGSA1]|uniref:arylsulfatase n=1 Tax=Algoriphagus sp. AGSA1 TaxID=2907213 RepID=UPI001F38B9E0|nr:arylsulfatase [Algoriphagus sp. AGSA1]MCE7057946.1 arylsulfatase [Algoriphagus sp. AGSA1]